VWKQLLAVWENGTSGDWFCLDFFRMVNKIAVQSCTILYRIDKFCSQKFAVDYGVDGTAIVSLQYHQDGIVD